MNEIDLSNDSYFKWAIRSIWFCGTCYLLLGLLCPASMILLYSVAPAGGGDEQIVNLITGIVMFPVGVACAIGNFVVASALKKRKKWAWIGGLIIGLLYAPSGCMPFGALILYGLLRNGVKQAYEAEANALSGAPVPKTF